MDMRKRTYLEQQEWRETCFYGRRKEPLHALIDIVAAGPGLREASDQLRASHNFHGVPLEDFANLRDRMEHMLKELFLWRWEWERNHPFMAYEIPVEPHESFTINEDGTPLYTAILYYNEMHQGARAITLYNMSLLVILELAETWNITDLPSQVLSGLAGQESESSNPLLMPHAKLSRPEIVDEMCRSIEYHLLSEHSVVGALHLMLPIRTLLKLHQPPRLGKWLKGVTRRISGTCGFEFSRRLSNPNMMATDSR